MESAESDVSYLEVNAWRAANGAVREEYMKWTEKN